MPSDPPHTCIQAPEAARLKTKDDFRRAYDKTRDCCLCTEFIDYCRREEELRQLREEMKQKRQEMVSCRNSLSALPLDELTVLGDALLQTLKENGGSVADLDEILADAKGERKYFTALAQQVANRS